MRENKGVLMVFASAILYGSYGIWSVWLGSEFESFFQGYVRSIVVLAVLIPLCIATKTWQRIEREHWRSLITAALFAAFVQVTIYYAFLHAGVGIATLVMFSTYLFTSFILGRIILGEELTQTKMISLAIGCLGLIVVFSSSLGDFSVLALGSAALSGFCFGGYVSTSKLIPQKYSGLQSLTIVWGIGLVICLTLSLALGEAQLRPTLDRHWLVMLIYAASGIVGSYCVIEGFKRIDASIGALIGLLEIVFGVFFGIVIFHEPFTANRIVGSAIIFIAAALPNLGRLRSQIDKAPNRASSAG